MSSDASSQMGARQGAPEAMIKQIVEVARQQLGKYCRAGGQVIFGTDVRPQLLPTGATSTSEGRHSTPHCHTALMHVASSASGSKTHAGRYLAASLA